MNRTSRVAAGLLCSFACCAVAWAGSVGQDGGTLILDESAYCRAYYRFDVQRIAPKALKAEGEKVLGATLMERLQADVEKRLAPKHYDWQKEDWRDYVTADVEYNSFARKNRPRTDGVAKSSTIRRGRTCGSRTAWARRLSIPLAPRNEAAGCEKCSCVSASRFPIPPRQEP
jgi:hypothetical protein